MYLTSSNFLSGFSASGKTIFKTIIRRSDGSVVPDDKMPDFLDGTVNIQNDSVRRKCTLSFRTQTPSVEWLEALDDAQAQWEVFAGTSRENISHDHFKFPSVVNNNLSAPSLTYIGNTEIIVRVKADIWTSVSDKIIVAQGYGGGSYWILITPGGTFYAAFRVGAAGFPVASGALTPGKEYWLRTERIAATGTISLYIGEAGTTEPKIWTPAGTTASTVGNIDASANAVQIGETFNGEIYQVIIRNNGVTVFQTGNGDVPKNPAATSYIASTGQTVTIVRAGASPTLIMPLTTDAVEELVPQGKFYVKDTPIDEPGSYITYRLSLQDASLPVGERRTTAARTYSGDITDVVLSIINNTGFETIFRQTSTGVKVTNYLVDIDQDPWDVCYKLLESVGFEFFFDVTGQCVIRPISDIGTNTLSSLDLSNCILSKQSTLNRRAINHIIVISTDNGAASIPYRGEAFDNDPSSPAYYQLYGDVPKIFRASGVTSTEQATLMAEKLGVYHFKRSESIMFAALSYPVLEVNDPFMVDGEAYLADQISVPLAVGRPMYVTSHKGPFNG